MIIRHRQQCLQYARRSRCGLGAASRFTIVVMMMPGAIDALAFGARLRFVVRGRLESMALGFVVKRPERHFAVRPDGSPDVSRISSVVTFVLLAPFIPGIEAIFAELGLDRHSDAQPRIAVVRGYIGERSADLCGRTHAALGRHRRYCSSIAIA